MASFYAYFFAVFVCSFVVTRASCFNFETSKVTVHKPSYAKSTNFGYSVAGYRVENDSWILIGAPLTQRERMHDSLGGVSRIREGAIYRCRVGTPNSCYMLPFDKKDDWNEVRDHYGVYYSENKTDQFLGATLQVADDVILACAPNYRHVSRVIRQDEFRYEPTGICYTLKEKMRKFEEHSPCRNAYWGHHRQGYCQAGFSGAIAKNDSTLYLSGPGAWYWQGMIFSIDLNNKDIKHKYPEKSGQGNEDDSYRGYSLSVGHFDEDDIEDIVVSAPRGHNCRGSIEIFSSNFKLLHTIHGYQIGAYFGSSILAVDLNNDGYDDIVVGSPMFKKDTENYDIGRIDIYIRSLVQSSDPNTNVFLFKNYSLNGFKARSRFGLAMAKLGDVNDDGFNDIAVAAPYDGEDASGIVYIFHGSAEGLEKTPAQIIKGADYDLKTFGFSLSGGLDLDGNKYPDLIIGAYKSDAVAFLRSRPVIKTTFSAQTTPKVIDLDSKNSPSCGGDKSNKSITCVDFEFCIQYYGKAVPASLRMAVTFELDFEKYQNESLIRANFIETHSPFLSQNYTFKYDQKRCFKRLISVKKYIKDKFAPIKCRINMSLPTYSSDWELMPLFSGKEESKIHEIRFLRNCGADDICTPNLQVTATTPSKKYVYGSGSHIDINVKVENVREDAFEAQCQIVLPSGINYVKAFVGSGKSGQNATGVLSSLTCTQNIRSVANNQNETRITCDIGNPMVAGSVRTFTIRVSPQSIDLNEDLLKFNISVSSSNKEEKSTLFDNEYFVYVALDAAPDLALIGKQYQEQVIYDTSVGGDLYTLAKTLTSNEADEVGQEGAAKSRSHAATYDLDHESEIGPEIMHEYKLLNMGPSRISRSELLITWQKQIKISGNKHRDLLYLMETPYTEGPIRCNYDHSMINWLNLTNLENDHLKNPQKYYMESSRSPNDKRTRRRSLTDGQSLSSTAIGYFDSLFKQYYNYNSFVDVSEQNVECSSAMIKRSAEEMANEDEEVYQSAGSKRPLSKKQRLTRPEQQPKLAMIKSNVYDFYCASLHCYVGELNADESALIRLRFRLWARNLALDSEVYQIRTYAMSTVNEIPYKKLNLNLDLYQKNVQVETIAHPKERKHLLQQLDLKIVILSIIAGVILLILLIIVLWCFGFFKRFEPPQDLKKLNELSEEEMSSSNDVIDVSKECSKFDYNSRENMNLIASASTMATQNGNGPLKPVNANQSKLLANGKEPTSNFNLNVYLQQQRLLAASLQQQQLKNHQQKSLVIPANGDDFYSATKVHTSNHTLNKNGSISVLPSHTNSLTKKPVTSSLSIEPIHHASSNQLNAGNTNASFSTFQNNTNALTNSLMRRPVRESDSYTNKLPPVPRRTVKMQPVNGGSSQIMLSSTMTQSNNKPLQLPPVTQKTPDSISNSASSSTLSSSPPGSNTSTTKIFIKTTPSSMNANSSSLKQHPTSKSAASSYFHKI